MFRIAFLAAAVGLLTVPTLFDSARRNAVDRDDEVAPRKPWTTSRIKGSPHPPVPFRVAPAFGELKFQRPTSLCQIPGTNRMLVTQIDGQVFSFEKSADVTSPDTVINLRHVLRDEFPTPNVELFHAVFHPEFATNGYVFLCYVHPGDGRHTRVSRFRLTVDPIPKIDASTEKVVITWPPGGHNGGCLEFGPDGYLYISTGDGSGPNPPDLLTTGQDVTDLLGAILRIDVDCEDESYLVPPDNPFVDLADARPEIYGYGLRNPFKFGIDAETGDVMVADNGWETWELIHRIQNGTNAGWPVMEGRVVLRSEVPVGPTPIVPPVKDHPHTEANSVIGGPVYRGNKLSKLNDYFVYGDYVTGTIWALHAQSPDLDHQTLVDTDLRIVAFGTGSEGELYVVDYDFTGKIYELLPSEVEDRSADFPRRLSETGLFASLSPMQPADGVVTYDVVVQRWLDGAKAQRWVAIPGKETIDLSFDRSPSEYPDGTVLVKHITMGHGEDEFPIETQLLHYENESWHPYSYLWNETYSDALLVDASGADQVIRLSDDRAMDRTWHVSAQNECRLCHNAGAGSVLGFTAAQLDKPNTEDESIGNQIKDLFATNVVASDPSRRDESYPSLCDPWDESQSIEDRARSYLHANCSMCHHPGGNAIVSFYLRRDMRFNQLNTNKGSGIGTFGLEHARVIAPGDPYRSLLLYRMSKLGYSRMPYIGSHSVDSRAIGLIDEWIRSMEPDGTRPLSAAVVDASPTAGSLNRLTRGELDRDSIREEIQSVLSTTEGTLALVSRMHAGALPPDVAREAVELGRDSDRSDIRGLIEAFVPESERRKTLGPHPDPNAILELAGDVDRGELIYLSDSARCRNCHDPSDPSKSLGPTLPEISKKHLYRPEILEHVLEPNKSIDDKFATYTALTVDGRVIVGLSVEQTDEAVTLKTAEHKVIRIPRDDMEDLSRSDQSLMPTHLLSDLTAQEAADLLEYIKTRK